uniref:Nucleolar protein 6 n=1 Tax=Globisporangium ultimum (strain ATCC 200006 / CBS 805.95 / DAOM BR144) TaxID=431595 RepID=K3WBL1_GLOUD
MTTVKTPLQTAAAAATANGDVDVQQLRKVLSKYALPSASELRHLHSADPTNSYRSSFFRLQVDQLLEAVHNKPSAKSAAGIQSLLFEVKSILDGVAEQQVTQEALQTKGLHLRNHVKRKEIVLSFHKPTRLDIVGSFILKNMAYAKKTNSEYGVFTVDIAIEMPADCFLPKDFANYRYFDKRNLYLGVLVAEMQSRPELFSKVTLAGFNGEYEKPIAMLHVNPAHLSELGIKGIKMCIRLIPVITSDVFKVSKLAPSRNNIRHDPDMTEEEMKQCRTPLYNNSILEDMMVRQHTRELHAALTESPQFAEACILAKVWIRQRGFHKTQDSVNGFLISMLLLYLYLKKRIHAQTPSDQMFKVLVQFIASHKLESEPLQFPPTEGGVVLTTEGLQTFQSSFELVVLDSSGRLNLFGRITKSAWKELQNCAKDSVKLIQHCSMDDFRALFIKKNEFWTRYDQYFWFPAPTKVDDADDETYTVEEKRCINDMGLERFWSYKLQSILSKALTDRVHLVRPILDDAVEWTMSDDSLPSRRKVAVGLRIDPDNAWRIVDKGPAADDKQASLEYRQFWKGKSELRRFKDGTIIEAVVWDEISPDTKHRVLDAIVRFIAMAHCPQLTSSDMIKTSNASLYSALNVEEVPAISTKKSSGLSASFESTMNSVSKLWVIFNGFAKALRDLDSLPIKVIDVIPVHPGFRYTSLFPLQPHPLAFSKGEQTTATPMAHVNTVLEPLVLHLKFERSSSWPNEKEALLHAKTGFYVQIAHELETHKKLRCEVARDGIDVFVSGYAFRLVIHSEKELGIVTGAAGAKKVALVNSPEYVATKQEVEYLSKHANTIHALHSKNTSFGPTVRLAQRWLADKFLSNTLRVEAIELMVAHIFINSSETTTPHSVLSGFLRFLKLLASYDWQQAPLAVDLNGTLDDTKQREIVKRFEASSVSPLAHPALFIAADYEDMDCLSSWTRFSPNKVILQRLVSLAQTSYDSLVQWLAHGASNSGWKPAFASSKFEFDAIIELSTEQLPAKKMKIDDAKKHAFTSPVYKNMDLTAVPVLVGFDPVQQLLEDLTARFGHLALFFINDVERSAILLTWKPQAFLPTKFRAIASNCLVTLPKAHDEDDATTTDGEAAGSRSYAVPNVFEVLSEIQRMGEGMVESIALHPFHQD